MTLRVLIDGLGPGGSLAAALGRQGAECYLHHRRNEVSAEAAARGWGKALNELDPSIEIDIAITCVPVDIVAERVRAIHPAHPGALISGIGSTKGGIADNLADLQASGHFIGSHPMYGSRAQGLAHAQADLYHGARVVLCPERPPRPSAWRNAQTLARLRRHHLRMDPAKHDRVVAGFTHPPRALRLAARRLNDEAYPGRQRHRDTTRVAAGSPKLWNGILQETAAWYSTKSAAASPNSAPAGPKRRQR